MKLGQTGRDMKADSGPQLSNTLALKKTSSSFLVKDAGSELNQIQAESDRGEPGGNRKLKFCVLMVVNNHVC